jgi:hypothetical protein
MKYFILLMTLVLRIEWNTCDAFNIAGNIILLNKIHNYILENVYFILQNNKIKD